MPAKFLIAQRLIPKLIEQGLVPEHCIEMELTISTADIVHLHYTILLTAEQMESLGKAIQAAASPSVDEEPDA